MKKIIVFLSFAALMMLGATACSGNKKADAKPEAATNAKAVIYTCPMHPEVQSDKPGSCPKCGMTLVEKK